MSSDLQKFTLQDLDEIDKVEDSIKKKRKLIIKGLIEQGIAKMVYILGSGDFDNIDGFTPEVNLHAILVTSENKEALKNLHYVSYSLDEDPIYHGKDGMTQKHNNL
jgi:UTP-glucose-1-phosphate uridylyltransferase